MSGSSTGGTNPDGSSADGLTAHGSTVAALIAATPFYRWLGLRAEGDHVVLDPREHHIGDSEHGLMHGGALASLLEAACALHLEALTGSSVRAVEHAVDFLRPVPAGEVRCTVTVVRLGKRVANLRTDAWQGDPARPLAVGHGTWVLA